MSIRASELSEPAKHQSSDRPGVYAPIASAVWNAFDMHRLNSTKDDWPSPEFGTLTLFQLASAESALTPIAAQKLDLQFCSSPQIDSGHNACYLTDIPKDHPNYRQLAKEYFGAQAKEYEMISQIQKASEKKEGGEGSVHNLSESDSKTQTPKASLSKIEIREEIKPGVSKEFQAVAENWIHNKIPHHLQQMMHDSGIGLVVCDTSSQVPEKIREQHARNHKNPQEKVGNLTMFYDPESRSMIFIEHPDKTSAQKHTQEIMAHGGIQTYQHGPDEENAWHELGHALDRRTLKGFSQSKVFDDAYKIGMDSMSTDEKRYFYYYCLPSENAEKGQEYAAPKEELFAQIFAAEHTPPNRRTETDIFLLNHFKKLADLMRDEKHQLFSSGQ